MELKQIKDLMAAMSRVGLKKLRLKDGDFELELEKDYHGKVSPLLTEELVGDENPLKQDFEKHKAHFTKRESVENTPEDLNATFILSPMVGTFYTSSSPTDPAFLKVGDKVDKNSVVCIVEAMKVMNEIKSGVQGTVAEVLVENGHPVEFGTKLFKIV